MPVRLRLLLALAIAIVLPPGVARPPLSGALPSVPLRQQMGPLEPIALCRQLARSLLHRERLAIRRPWPSLVGRLQRRMWRRALAPEWHSQWELI